MRICIPLKKTERVIELKKTAAPNSLGVYLTNKNIGNVDIFAKTCIPTNDLSRMRNGDTLSISAERLFLISLVSGDPIKEVLLKIFPELKLKKTDKPILNEQKAQKLTTFGKLVKDSEDFTLAVISHRTGLGYRRLYNLSTFSATATVLQSHELLLVEMALDKEPGELFTALYSHLELNSEEERERLRTEEKERNPEEEE